MTKAYFPGKLNPKVKKKWIKALRSGKYLQNIEGLLFSKGSYCCLGVLCKVHSVSNEDIQYITLPYNIWINKMKMWETPPDPIYKGSHTGATRNPMVKYKGRWRSLASLNDRENLSFAQIADLIEEQL